MPRLLNLIGQRFGRLVVKALSNDSYHGHALWICECDCGRLVKVPSVSLRQDATKSYGCLRRELLVIKNASHNMTESPEYRAWRKAKERCSNPRVWNFHNYGGRGIRMCPEWEKNFEAFVEHIGLRPSPEHSLDRINNDGHYEPGNVRWATRSQQMFNRRKPRGTRSTVTQSR